MGFTPAKTILQLAAGGRLRRCHAFFLTIYNQIIVYIEYKNFYQDTQVTRTQKFTILIFFFLLTPLWSEVKEPNNPGVPDVRFDNKQLSSFPAEIIFASGMHKKGIIQFPGKSIKYYQVVNNVKKYKEVSISDIKAIEFYEWKGEKKWKGNYIFYPSFLKVHLKDRKIMEITSNISELNKIEFIDREKKYLFYTYFYDYRKNNKWLSSGIIDFDYPEKNPHSKTVTKITFIKSGKGIDLNNLIKKILE